LFGLSYEEIHSTSGKGKNKALEIMGKAREEYIVEITEERESANSFEDFKASEKTENASPYFSHTVTFAYPKGTPNKFTLHVTECL
jgi:hypothetical protein